MNDVDFIVTLNFSCGKTMRVSYSKEKIQDFLKIMKSGWCSSYIVGEKFGVNFAQVSFYEVEEVK